MCGTSLIFYHLVLLVGRHHLKNCMENLLKIMVLYMYLAIAYYHVRESKLDPRAKKALFMGITSGVKGYCLWCPETRKVIFSRDVTFDESTLTNKVTVEEVKQIDGASKQVEFEGKIIFPTQGSNEETTKDFLLKESQSKRRFHLKNLSHNLNQ